MSQNICTAMVSLVFVSLLFLGGCSSGDYLDPTQVGRFRPVPAVNVILDSLGVADEEPSSFAGAEEPKPMDAVAYEKDYAFNSGDVVRISIYELEQEGQTYVNDFQVTETGKISIPQVGQVQATGLTESQLEDEIRQILSPAILKEPLVTAILQNSQSRSFTILGDGVPKPDRYTIPRYDFRLADALAVAGSPRQFNVSYIYITRRVSDKESQMLEETKGTLIPSTEDEMMQIIQPHAKAAKNKTIINAAEMGTPETARPAAGSLNDQISGELENMVDEDSKQPVSTQGPHEDKGPVEWIFQDGKWRPVRPGEGARPETPTRLPSVQKPDTVEPVPSEPVKQEMPAGIAFEELASDSPHKRILKIPVKEFFGADPRYNVIIKPGDVIWVPVDRIGEFYVLGNANNQGVVNMTGRPVTLMKSIAAAGGLGPLAWPERIEIRRQISDIKEEIVLVNLKKIADGSQPDFYIKPNDLINIGTHPAARWLATLRNAFRATYGFGFIYDRNFADRDFGGNPLP